MAASFHRCNGGAPWRSHAMGFAVFALVLPQASAADVSAMRECRSIESRDQRLACYDGLVPAPATVAQHASVVADLAGIPTGNKKASTDRWHIEHSTEKGSLVHTLRPHKPNYVVLRQTTAPNNNPFRDSVEFESAPGTVKLDHNELKFQFSVKAPLSGEKDWLLGGSFWLGYTQQSYWQIWNASASRPFRESNYEPEAMIVWKTEKKIPVVGLDLNHIVAGFVHQSNGRGDPLSRSWNRFYAQFEMSRGPDFEVIARPWFRVPEDRAKDNNYEIHRYMGYGDLIFNTRWPKRVETSLLIRNNLHARHNRSAFQLDVTIACWLFGQFSPKLQFFIGPGESLIDFNHRQKSLGIGFEASNWFDTSFDREKRCRETPAGSNKAAESSSL